MTALILDTSSSSGRGGRPIRFLDRSCRRPARLERETPITSATVFIGNRPSAATTAAAVVFFDRVAWRWGDNKHSLPTGHLRARGHHAVPRERIRAPSSASARPRSCGWIEPRNRGYVSSEPTSAQGGIGTRRRRRLVAFTRSPTCMKLIITAPRGEVQGRL